jgi:hypothetical protein
LQKKEIKNQKLKNEMIFEGFFWEFGGSWSPISFTYDYNTLMAWKELWIYGMYYNN